MNFLEFSALNVAVPQSDETKRAKNRCSAVSRPFHSTMFHRLQADQSKDFQIVVLLCTLFMAKN